jgi:hypothetical protein
MVFDRIIDCLLDLIDIDIDVVVENDVSDDEDEDEEQEHYSCHQLLLQI